MALSEDEVGQIDSYVRGLQERMGLQHWTVVVHDDVDPEPDTDASIAPAEEAWVAHLRTGPCWPEIGAEDRRRVLVHEMLHLCHRAQTDVVRLGFPATDLIPEAAWKGLWHMFYIETERMVDHLSQVIAPTMPGWGADVADQ